MCIIFEITCMLGSTASFKKIYIQILSADRRRNKDGRINLVNLAKDLSENDCICF